MIFTNNYLKLIETQLVGKVIKVYNYYLNGKVWVSGLASNGFDIEAIPTGAVLVHENVKIIEVSFAGNDVLLKCSISITKLITHVVCFTEDIIFDDNSQACRIQVVYNSICTHIPLTSNVIDSYATLVAEAKDYQSQVKDLRLGQALMVIMCTHFKEHYHKLTSSACDPFYSDDKIPAFYDYIRVNNVFNN